MDTKLTKAKTIIYVKDNQDTIHGPFTIKELERTLNSPHPYISWIWYKTTENWEPINIRKLFSEANHSNSQYSATSTQSNTRTPTFDPKRQTKTSPSIRQTDLMDYQILCIYKKKLLEVNLDQINPKGCIMFFSHSNKSHNVTNSDIPYFQIGTEVILNLLNSKEGIAENVVTSVQQIKPFAENEKSFQYQLKWDEVPLCFRDKLKPA